MSCKFYPVKFFYYPLGWYAELFLRISADWTKKWKADNNYQNLSSESYDYVEICESDANVIKLSWNDVKEKKVLNSDQINFSSKAVS